MGGDEQSGQDAWEKGWREQEIVQLHRADDGSLREVGFNLTQ